MNPSIALANPIRGTRRVAESLALQLRRWSTSPRERYLQAASNHAELEQRLRVWEEQQRRTASFALLV
jgi:hypothetical protein